MLKKSKENEGTRNRVLVRVEKQIRHEDECKNNDKITRTVAKR
jgi:hypothetical protein